MPLRWTIDSEQKLVTTIADGEVERSEFEAYLDAVSGAGANSWRKLYDGSRSDMSMGPEAFMALGVRMRAAHGTGPMGALAVVVPEAVVEPFSRLLGVLATAKRPMRIFSHIEPARRWILRQVPSGAPDSSAAPSKDPVDDNGDRSG